MFCVAAAGTTLLWLPLTVLPILDGLLFVAPLREVLRDLGLLGWLGLLPAFALATLARAVTGVTGLAGMRAAKAALTGWTVLLLPLTWVCGWQAARTGWQWARTVLGVDLVITPAIRSLAMLALATAIIWTVRRVSLVATVQHGGWMSQYQAQRGGQQPQCQPPPSQVVSRAFTQLRTSRRQPPRRWTLACCPGLIWPPSQMPRWPRQPAAIPWQLYFRRRAGEPTR
ncbi:MAG: hypothetical protein EBY28_23310 [Betaproteobacteria bacterium]|nr:hypothetical protein [Betaproteobacteria bacterium]